ncbi:hypothetical protein LTR70_010053 [Exophiala xenobiotica]|uniref:Uncharacterized protein n=1 Tax=Lithohypha guttulata TaxID=1690604 RepID=A0ABR0JVF5_9EURO|nr:hypothetical protein LTR24_009970 [Lithohypha guttulata]KAK5309714.1 hypothetical protein LTR70_010053 [Exophiala xenobiotica]
MQARPGERAIREVEITSLVSRDEAQDLDFGLFRRLEHITLRPHPTRWLLQTQFHSKIEETTLGEFQCAMDSEARGLYDMLESTTQAFRGLKAAFRKGVLFTLIRNLQVNTDTVYRSWHNVSLGGLELVSVVKLRLLPWKKKNQPKEERG